ncbi:adaptor protein MecA [Weissella confusa]|uniref:adaptor protein MecA n=1 Tax=Weissella confusa TaxID=1583 RepID=UPI002433D049|nr:adaptor protein MecA [Weissella confusa]
MEMERINEDTIRVVVTNDDLAERSISVIDLLGNQEEIERFFYNILEEVDVEHDFENNEAVTFQVLPNRNGLELFISKNIGDKAMMDGVINSMFGNRDAGDVNDDVSDSLLEQLLDNDGTTVSQRLTVVPVLKNKLLTKWLMQLVNWHVTSKVVAKLS